jgi:hypothetical protein
MVTNGYFELPGPVAGGRLKVASWESIDAKRWQKYEMAKT